MKPLSKQLIDEIKKLINDGLSNRQVSNQLKISIQTVRKYGQRVDRRVKLTPQMIDEIMGFIQSGKQAAQAARHFDLSIETIRRAIKKP
jgi:hypothetical protein